MFGAVEEEVRSNIEISSSPLPVEENVFGSPWKKSDVILVVEETEFHVHRFILSMQSPVFEAMLDGHFKEANQEKITIKGKDPDDMLRFLKLLYPANMFKKPLISFCGENVLNMLALADEYQAENVMNQCLQETEITPKNTFQIMPYAFKYNQSVREKCFDVITRGIKTDEVKNRLLELDNELVQEILLSKCRFLESIARSGNDLLILLLRIIVKGIKDVEMSFRLSDQQSCGHSLSVDNFHLARKCELCLRAYKNIFIARALDSQPSLNYGWGRRRNQSEDTNKLFKLLGDTDDVLSS